MNRQKLSEYGFEESIVFENPDFDDAIIGVTEDERVIYDYQKMIKCLMDEGMDIVEAAEFIDYNTIRALAYQENGPIILMYRIEEI